jgi:hypothetical protein
VRHLQYSAAESERWRVLRKLFWIDARIEWRLVGVAAFVLARFGRSDLIPQVFGVIIGPHLLPLAKIFRAPRYYWTGGVMMVGALGSLLIPRSNIRNIVGCAAVGLTLWVTGTILLCGSLRQPAASRSAMGRTR